MQTVLVILVVAIAAAFLIRNFLKKFKQEDACSCGCSSCPAEAASCEENPDDEPVAARQIESQTSFKES